MEKEAADVDGRRRRGEGAPSSFSATCRRLSQYLREKGSLGELSFGMVAATPSRRVEGKPEALRTLNLLPGVEAPPAAAEIVPRHHPVLPDLNRDQKPAQLTIFYGGKLVVFNNFSAEQAKELVDMADRACPPPAHSSPGEPPAAVPPLWPEKQPLVPASTVLPSETKHPPAAATVTDLSASPAAPKEEVPQKPTAPASSDLPIARRVSLHRFLEKRKDRITAKAPYPVNTSPPDKGEGDGRPWLGLAPQYRKAAEDSAGARPPPTKSIAASGSGA